MRSLPNSQCNVLLVAILSLLHGVFVLAQESPTEPPTEAEILKAADEYFDRSKKSIRSGQERDFQSLISDLKTVCELNDAEVKAVETDVKELVTMGLEHWQTIYRVHFRAHYAERDAPTLWLDFGKSIHSAECVRLGTAIHTAWQALLKKNLPPEDVEKWNAEMEVRKQRIEKALPAYFEKMLPRAVEGMQRELSLRFLQLMTDAGKGEAEKQKVTKEIEAAAKAYGGKWQEGAKEELLEVVVGFRHLSQKSVDSLEKNQSRAIYLRNQSTMKKEAETRVETLVNSLITPEDRKRIADAESLWKARSDKAVSTAVNLMWQQHETEAKTRLQGRLETLGDSLNLDETARKAFLKDYDLALVPAVNVWKAKLTDSFHSGIKQYAGSSDREDILKRVENGNMSFSNSTATRVLETAKIGAWETTLKRHLTQEQIKKWEEAEKAARDFRGRALARLVVTQLDDAIKLTKTQRQQLEELILPTSFDVAQLPGGLTEIVRYSYLREVLCLLHGIQTEKLEALLDAKQKSHLKQVLENGSGDWQRLESRIKELKKLES